MQSIQLTHPELAFITDLFSSYRNRRLAAIRKTGKNTSSQAMEKQSLAVIHSKLEAMSSQASAEAEAVQEINHLVEEVAQADVAVIAPFV